MGYLKEWGPEDTESTDEVSDEELLANFTIGDCREKLSYRQFPVKIDPIHPYEMGAGLEGKNPFLCLVDKGMPYVLRIAREKLEKLAKVGNNGMVPAGLIVGNLEKLCEDIPAKCRRRFIDLLITCILDRR